MFSILMLLAASALVVAFYSRRSPESPGTGWPMEPTKPVEELSNDIPATLNSGQEVPGIQCIVQRPAGAESGWHLCTNTVFHYALQIPSDWHISLSPPGVTHFGPDPTVEGGFGVTINVGCLPHGWARNLEMAGQRLAISIDGQPATQYTYRWEDGPGRDLVGFIDVQVEYQGQGYCIELEPSIDDNVFDLETFDTILGTFRFDGYLHR